MAQGDLAAYPWGRLCLVPFVASLVDGASVGALHTSNYRFLFLAVARSPTFGLKYALSPSAMVGAWNLRQAWRCSCCFRIRFWWIQCVDALLAVSLTLRDDSNGAGWVCEG